MSKFSHLHVHTQFSLLDGAADISNLYKKAVNDKMPAVAITDHGNMFGVFKFVAESFKYNKESEVIKPIVGCEFYLVENRHKQQFTKEDRDKRYHQLFLAKDTEGYKNLIKLCSLGYIEGLYGKYPRIDKELVLVYHKGLIATTCCLGASVPKTILRFGEAEGEKEFKWWLDIFQEDYYIELQRHDIPDQNIVNEVLLKWAIKYNVKVIASNDSHYVDQQDYNAPGRRVNFPADCKKRRSAGWFGIHVGQGKFSDHSNPGSTPAVPKCFGSELPGNIKLQVGAPGVR